MLKFPMIECRVYEFIEDRSLSWIICFKNVEKLMQIRKLS